MGHELNLGFNVQKGRRGKVLQGRSASLVGAHLPPPPAHGQYNTRTTDPVLPSSNHLGEEGVYGGGVGVRHENI